MPRWKLRDPTVYPINFTETLIRASIDGEAYLEIVPDAKHAKVLQQRFCCFRYCLRNWPYARMHRAYSAEMQHSIRAKVVPFESRSAVVITAKPLIVDSIAALNPGLIDEIT